MAPQPSVFKSPTGTVSYVYLAQMGTLRKGLMTVQACHRQDQVCMNYLRDGHGSSLSVTPTEARALADALYAAADASEPPGPVFSQDEVRYSLSRHVENMPRGFTLQTGYGDLVVPDGWLANRLTGAVRHALELHLSSDSEALA